MASGLSQKDDALLEAMAQDAVRLSRCRGRPCFVGFLDEREQAVVRRHMERLGQASYLFWGGHGGAERAVFGAFSPWEAPSPDAFPITAVTAAFRPQDQLCHRDFLGALMSLGIERSAVGDILAEPGRGVFFLRAEVAPYVLAQITKVGAVGVRLFAGAEEPYPVGRQPRELDAAVQSLRLDCVAAACTGQSRQKVKAQITAGLAAVNGLECVSPSALLAEGDKLSLRGTGKFCLEQVGGLTRKGRIRIKVKKY